MGSRVEGGEVQAQVSKLQALVLYTKVQGSDCRKPRQLVHHNIARVAGQQVSKCRAAAGRPVSAGALERVM